MLDIDARPQRDYGTFGPDSVVWKVASYPTSFTVAFARTVAVEVLEPFVMASIGDTQSVATRPALRYQRTLQYTATLIFGDSQGAVRAADTLMRIHRRIRGTEPMTGATYDALHPEGQLWIHLTEWHSLLYTYEILGPGRLSKEEDEQYWAECRRAAIFQTIDPERIPRNRAEASDYLETMRPRLAGSEAAQKTFQQILDFPVMNEDMSAATRGILRLSAPILRAATIATIPQWMRSVGGVRQSRIVDAAAILAARSAFAVLHRAPASLKSDMVRVIAPLAYPALAPAFLGLEPIDPRVVDPAEAWRTADRPTPRTQYLDMLATRTEVSVTRHDDPRSLLPFSG